MSSTPKLYNIDAPRAGQTGDFHSSPGHQNVGVEGNHFTLNGKPWVPRAVGLRAFEAPTSYTKSHEPLLYKAAHFYGRNELKAIHAYGADTIRLLISQPSLDPKSPKYNPQYKQQLVKAVKLARSHNFVVELAMQDEPYSGSKKFYPLARGATMRCWDSLNKVFGKDKGVMFELYNEPALQATPHNWHLWAHGGHVPAQGDVPAFKAVGMQQMIDQLRKDGSQNTFVLDGLHFAKTLNGLPQIHDPLNRVGYAVHPYFDGHVASPQTLTKDFGNASKTVPVFADEWSASSGPAGAHGGLGLLGIESYHPTVNYVNYLRAHGIGVSLGGFDAAHFALQHVPDGPQGSFSAPYTNYDHYSSDKKGGNVGMLLHNDFMTPGRSELPYSAALSPQGPEPPGQILAGAQSSSLEALIDDLTKTFIHWPPTGQ